MLEGRFETYSIQYWRVVIRNGSADAHAPEGDSGRARARARGGTEITKVSSSVAIPSVGFDLADAGVMGTVVVISYLMTRISYPSSEHNRVRYFNPFVRIARRRRRRWRWRLVSER